MTIKERKLLQKKNFIRLIFSYLHEPYKWGGNDPEEGFDCSGMVVDALQAIGFLKPHEDYPASGLFKIFSESGTVIERVKNGEEPKYAQKGDLLFWFNYTGKCYHVAVAIDKLHCMTADGGGDTTLTLDDAVEQDAFVKVRPIAHRSTELRIVRIF